MRLGIPLPFSQVIHQCDCGACLDEHGYHLLTSKYGGGPVWQHNTIVSTWAKCLDELSIPHQETGTLTQRPVAYDPDGHTTTDLDISMAHPHSGDTLRRAALKSGYAAELREKRKVKKYGQQQSQSGTHTPCIPLVFEHFGFWGPMAEEYLDSISKKSKDVNGRNNEADFRDRWRKQLSILLFNHVTLA